MVILKKTEWISGIDIDKKRKAEIQFYFNNETKVHIAKEQDELDSLIETFKICSREETGNKNVINNSFGENRKLDSLLLWTMFLVLLMFQKNLLTF